MTKAEKAIEGLGILKQRLILQADVLGYGEHISDIDNALELLKGRQWVSVKDRLPENHAICLTYSPKGVIRIAQAFIPSSIPGSNYDKMECWWSTHGVGGVHSVKATHWMPLPEPPKEEDNA